METLLHRTGTCDQYGEVTQEVRASEAHFVLNRRVLCGISRRYEGEQQRAFLRWHLERKFEEMAKVFEMYLRPRHRCLDVGCGEGDCMVLARAIEPSCELWGVDLDERSLAVARQRLPGARLYRHDMANLSALPQGYFDVVHEFGAAFMFADWGLLARSYLSLVRIGGVVLWELPEAMSMAHWVYLLTRAPRISDGDTLGKRLWRSFLPSKYTFQSWPAVQQHLETSGFNYRIVIRKPFLYFHVGGRMGRIIDLFCAKSGSGILNSADRWAKHMFRRSSGYYLVLENLGKIPEPVAQPPPK